MMGLGGLLNIGMMLYGMSQQKMNLDAQAKSMDDINAEIAGGEKGEIPTEVEGVDKLGSNGENYLKLAGGFKKPQDKKESGLGFGAL